MGVKVRPKHSSSQIDLHGHLYIIVLFLIHMHPHQREDEDTDSDLVYIPSHTVSVGTSPSERETTLGTYIHIQNTHLYV